MWEFTAVCDLVTYWIKSSTNNKVHFHFPFPNSNSVLKNIYEIESKMLDMSQK